ncbi:MAG: DUF1007 family protein [Gammaproteobacteria bacterium]|nr:DUF1007 family protein [Gammaproteobacteria bacterium]
MRLWHFRVTVIALWAALSNPLNAGGYHYEIDVTSQLVGDASGQLGSLQVTWLYDKHVSLILFENEEPNPFGRSKKLMLIADRIIADLHEYNYYAKLQVDGMNQPFNRVMDYKLELTDDYRLQLNFMIPLAKTVSIAGRQLEVTWLDPTGTGLLLHRSVGSLSVDKIDTNCKIELENYPDYQHGELPQKARLECQ